MSKPDRTYFEDFEPGMETSFGAYKVTKEEVIEFASKYDPQPFHIDEDAAKSSIFGGLCASGWHTCAMTMRMMVDQMKETGTMSLGSPGVDSIRWVKPVFPGDTLTVTMKVVETRRLNSRPRVGNVRNDYSVHNDKGELVMTFRSNGFFAARNDG